MGRRNRKLQLTVGESHEFRPHTTLAHILGVGNSQWHSTGEHLASGQMTLPPRMQVTTLYAYCDILEHVIVGDVTAPMLRVVDMKLTPKKSKVHTIMNTPLFVPVQKKIFDTIEINLMTDTGYPAPFSSGKSNVVLELKRVGLLGDML